MLVQMLILDGQQREYILELLLSKSKSNNLYYHDQVKRLKVYSMCLCIV